MENQQPRKWTTLRIDSDVARKLTELTGQYRTKSGVLRELVDREYEARMQAETNGKEVRSVPTH